VWTTGTNNQRGTRVNLRRLDTGTTARALMMIDGMRYPQGGFGADQIDPSLIPAVAVERVDLLLDGASATYGSDAIAGVINIILRRNYNGALTEADYRRGAGGNNKYFASALWGRTWDGGQVTLSYQWSDASPTLGNVHSKFTNDHSPWGLDNRNPIGASYPATISAGAPSSTDPINYPGNLGTNCTNCWAVPTGTGRNWDPGASGIGPLAPGSAATLDWSAFNTAANSGTNGTRNVFNPYERSWYSAATQNTGGVITIDQRLTRNISFYGEGIWSMRRATSNDGVASGINIPVPTFNPYYPTDAPGGLRVAYSFKFESPIITKSWAMAQRYQLGLNVALPHDWAMQVYFSHTKDQVFVHGTGGQNKNAASAALGWTLLPTPPDGTTPGFGTWTKPASVPYLNLFCDPMQFTCNSPQTLAYIAPPGQGSHELMHVRERGIKADGPLFDLPGGTVKAALGANLTSYHFSFGSPSIRTDVQTRHVWAIFTQVNIPVFGDPNALPGLRRLELEFSWRHDQYSDVGGTSNPKVAFNWAPIEDLTIRGAWGTSFRAPNFGEFSPSTNFVFGASGLPTDVFGGNARTLIACDAATGRPRTGSGAEKLFNAGFACNSQPAGLILLGSGKPAVDAHWRRYVNTSEEVLEPEISTNWAIGFDYTPTGNFLTGLNLQATYYVVKINGILRDFGGGTNQFNAPSRWFLYIVPSDLRDPAIGAQLCPGMDTTPAACVPFQEMVQRALSQPNNAVSRQAQTFIYWVNDSGTMNKGWQKTTGYDFVASYDWEWGNLGRFNTGITGTYYESQPNQAVPGGEIEDRYDIDIDVGRGLVMRGVELRPRLIYRARLGWANGAWSATVFMDHRQHYFHEQISPPNVNNNCLTTGGTIGGGTFPCLIANYTNLQPSQYTFDLSIGYNTGEMPANEYLRNIGVQLVVQNIMDRVAAYQYRIGSDGTGNPCACDVLQPLYGRQWNLRVVKTW
jgi:iron complex outermembrane receptor protein